MEQTGTKHISDRPIYDRVLKALTAAHTACYLANKDVLGMSSGPFSGVNVVLGIVASLEAELKILRERNSIIEEIIKEEWKSEKKKLS